MSTDVETTESTTTDTSPGAPISTAIATARLAPWRRRRYQIAAIGVIAALIAGFVANNVLARQYTPDGAVRQYLGALQSGDANSAWTEIQVSAPAQPVAVALVDQAAMKAAIAAAKPDIKSFDITNTTKIDASTSVVAFSYETANGTKQAKFAVQRSGQTRFGLYPIWQLMVTPALLQINVPNGSGGVAIDGKAIGLAAGAPSIVAVLPVAHKIDFRGTRILAAQTIKVDATFSLGQAVAYEPTLTSDGAVSARAAILGAFDNCTKQTGRSPGGCPQTYSDPFIGSGRWQLVGDPTQDLAFSFDQNLNVVGTGHFQMVFSYQEHGIDGTNHRPSSGGYAAVLALTPTDVSVTKVSSIDKLPALQRPAGASDQAAKDLVAKAFAACAAAKSASPADCPQALSIVDVANVSWALSGDPVSGASVTFDQTNGLFTVRGNFSMMSTYYINGYASGRPSFTTSYGAYLLWDGQALQFITIAGIY